VTGLAEALKVGHRVVEGVVVAVVELEEDVSSETVLRWYRAGKLPAIRLPGDAIRFREDELETWLEEREGGMMATTAERTRDQRLRRMADRQGYRLAKSRRRDPRAIDFDKWVLLDKFTGGVIYGTMSGGSL
jgi:excisionase family DNA binding protein